VAAFELSPAGEEPAHPSLTESDGFSVSRHRRELCTRLDPPDVLQCILSLMPCIASHNCGPRCHAPQWPRKTRSVPA